MRKQFTLFVVCWAKGQSGAFAFVIRDGNGTLVRKRIRSARGETPNRLELIGQVSATPDQRGHRPSGATARRTYEAEVSRDGKVSATSDHFSVTRGTPTRAVRKVRV